MGDIFISEGKYKLRIFEKNYVKGNYLLFLIKVKIFIYLQREAPKKVTPGSNITNLIVLYFRPCNFLFLRFILLLLSKTPQ